MTDASGTDPGASQLAEVLSALRTVAEASARAGGSVARDAFARPPGVRLKADASVVTDADLAAQAAVIRVISAARPSDECIGEESDEEAERDGSPQSKIQNPKSKIVWLIDPIDGTRNFVRGSAAFACSVGALDGGLPIVGAIFEPLHDVLYSGDLVGGLRVNHAPRSQSAPDHDRGPSGPPGELVVSLPSTATPPVARLMHACVDRCVIRNVGSAALHLAMVATGEIDAALLATCKLWDLAAGAALVTATGGVMTDLSGEPLFPIDVARRARVELPCIAARTPQILKRLLEL